MTNYVRAGNLSAGLSTRTYDDFKLVLLAEIRDQAVAQTAEARKQTLEAIKQTAVLERLDERAKRNGFSLAKSNRK